LASWFTPTQAKLEHLRSQMKLFVQLFGIDRDLDQANGLL
jgi:hypothetical protein